MIRLEQLRLPLEYSRTDLEQAVAEALGVVPGQWEHLRLARRAIDARKKSAPFYVLTVEVKFPGDENVVLEKACPRPPGRVASCSEVGWGGLPGPHKECLRPVVVGAGPAGLFAALALAEAGWQPLLLERGKPVGERNRDVNRFWKDGTLDADSNVAFGEGGAGAFSDGKLTTRVKDRAGRVRKVLEALVEAGAPPVILFESKPHVGTDKLIPVIINLREKITRLGGTVRFGARLADIRFSEMREVEAVVLEGGESITADRVILATGHSARDIYSMLHASEVALVAKPFAIGVRIEHPQVWLDGVQFGASAGHPALGRADYQLTAKVGDRSIYTFCMCPGGEVIGAGTEPDGIVTNGMSRHARTAENANSAILINVMPKDFGGEDVLAGVAFQRSWEQRAFELAGGNNCAPAQRLEDFLQNRPSTAMGDVLPSYTPGVTPANLSGCLPDFVVAGLREGLPRLDRKLRGFAMPDAVLTGVETRSSSPVRVLRDGYGESESHRGLYPAGEGAGYAGGIISAAVDGLRAAEALTRDCKSKVEM